MKTLIVYFSQTGFTQKYTEWLAEALGGTAVTMKEASKKEDSFFNDYDAIIFGSWLSMEKIAKADWFTSRIDKWKGKKLAIFGVGASPAEYSGIQGILDKTLTDEQKKYARAFYCVGGLCYEKMSFGSKMLMKTFAAMLKSKKNKSEADKAMIEHVASSCDNTDKKYIEPIVAYING